MRYVCNAAKGGARVIVMDELGDLERCALRFQEAVLEALEGEMPVLGIIKLLPGGWADKARRHSNVKIINVDKKTKIVCKSVWLGSFAPDFSAPP